MGKVRLSQYAEDNNLSIDQAFIENMGQGRFYSPVMGDVRLSFIPDDNYDDFELSISLSLDFVKLPKKLEKNVLYKKLVKLTRFTDVQLFQEQLLGEFTQQQEKNMRSVDGIYRIGKKMPGVADTESLEKTAVIEMRKVMGGRPDKKHLQLIASAFDCTDMLEYISFDLSELFIESMRESPEEVIIREPKVIKGSPQTLRDWIIWKVKDDKYHPLNDFLPDGYQKMLIEKSYEFGYKDEGTVKRACRDLKLKFARNNN